MIFKNLSFALIPFVLLGTFTRTTPQAFAQKSSVFVEIASLDNGDHYFADKSSIRVQKKGRINQTLLTVTTQYKKTASDGTVKVLTKYLANCDANTLSIKQLWRYSAQNTIITGIVYNSNGNREYDYPGDGPIQKVYPNTVSSAIYKVACDR